MRQLGTLNNELDARRFMAYLIARGIDAHLDQHDQTWTVWVRDEDRREEAREEFEKFRANPGDPRYQQAEQEADKVLRERRQKQERSRRAMVDMRGRWRTAGPMPSGPRPPLTTALIMLSIGVTLGGWFGETTPGSLGRGIYETLYFVETADYLRSGNVFASLQRGEIWRVFTPMFLHMNAIHLIFNMFWLYALGKQIEWLRGSWRLALLVLFVGAVAHLSEAIVGGPRFGGMSGVVYGLFGYIWIRRTVQPSSGFMLDSGTVFILLLWLVLCFTGSFGPVANWAHLGGLVGGMLIGALPAIRGRAVQ